ncbi:MAG: hypothetical protein UX72_C0004G0032 [Parcubacteria group bacterium GW2011_GWA2_47_10]|nr:MAG: hypothetical protein UX72_C0004G0032 [Parcubacteria group bacterium GW2011_GWA2_47_10]
MSGLATYRTTILGFFGGGRFFFHLFLQRFFNFIHYLFIFLQIFSRGIKPVAKLGVAERVACAGLFDDIVFLSNGQNLRFRRDSLVVKNE